MRLPAVGERASLQRAFTREELAAYGALTGAQESAGSALAIPGPLLAGMFSTLLGTQLPGPGTNYLKQRLRFLSPARQAETLSAEVEVTRIRPEKALVNLATRCTGEDGRVICEGEALVLAAMPNDDRAGYTM